MEIIYRKEKWFGSLLSFLEKRENIFVAEVKKKIPRKEYYDVVMAELERLNNFAQKHYQTKIIEFHHNVTASKMEFVKGKNVAIKQIDDFMVITIEEQEKQHDK